MGWDLNPRRSCPLAGFQDRCFQPLSHPSGIHYNLPDFLSWVKLFLPFHLDFLFCDAYIYNVTTQYKKDSQIMLKNLLMVSAITTSTIASVFAASSSTPEAGERVTIRCIKSISSILKDLPAEGTPAVAIFDWDQTISKTEGGYTFRQARTPTVLKTLHDRGIPTMILTARGLGGSITKDMKLNVPRRGMHTLFAAQMLSDVQAAHESMITALIGSGDILKWVEQGPFKETKCQDIAVESASPQSKDEWLPAGYVRPAEARDHVHAVAANHIVFAGGKTKGKVAGHLIDHDLLKTTPTHVIFVDNASYNTEEFAKSFADRTETVRVYHYPNGAEDIIECSKCGH